MGTFPPPGPERGAAADAGPRTKVFGLGLNKTGTKTLRRCLEVLGYRHHSFSGPLLETYVAGRHAELVALTETFDSCEDWPWPLIWRELWNRWGDSARYVLTRRASSGDWIESLKAHALRTHPTRALRGLVYGYYYPHGYEAEHIAAYERHNDAVRRFFAREAPHAFLEISWEDGSSWKDLCDFLGHPIPDAPLPHERPLADLEDPARRAANLAGIERQLAQIAQGRRIVSTTPLIRGL